jgi:hypothetical protein
LAARLLVVATDNKKLLRETDMRRRPPWMIKLNTYGRGDWRMYADVV